LNFKVLSGGANLSFFQPTITLGSRGKGKVSQEMKLVRVDELIQDVSQFDIKEISIRYEDYY
jgi:hypothetical protein